MMRHLFIGFFFIEALLGGEIDIDYVRDVAPLMKEHCLECHRDGLSGPFSLDSYKQVRKRGKQIVEVIESGFMPPWLPSHSSGVFLGERGISKAEIGLIRKWYESGMKRGEGNPPPLPEQSEKWVLGKPDLIIRPEQSYTLPGDAETDVFRNFVIRIPVEKARFVRAVDFKARDPRVVHHAIMKIDRSGKSRLLQEADEMPGYGHDMKLPHAVNPDGHFLGWTPGKRPYESPDSAWRLLPGDELVVQLHLQPSGKAELIQPEVGLYFTDKLPRKRPFGILLYSLDLDIPPGEPRYSVSDEYILPVDCYLRVVYPHAHFLGKSVRVMAHSPNEKARVLLRILDWDFNWQDSYLYKEPPLLKAGTKLEMTWIFDNSESNIRNPNVPPKRIRYGLRTTDEMASTWLQLMPVRQEDLTRLKEHDRQHYVESLFKKGFSELKKNPNDISTHRKMAYLYRSVGELQKAERHYDQILGLDSKDVVGLRGKGDVARYGRRIDEAIKYYRKALAVTPNDADLSLGVGMMLTQAGKLDEAEKMYLESIRLRPEMAEAYFHLGNLYLSRGDRPKAMEQLRRAQKISPKNPAIQKRIRDLSR